MYSPLIIRNHNQTLIESLKDRLNIAANFTVSNDTGAQMRAFIQLKSVTRTFRTLL